MHTEGFEVTVCMRFEIVNSKLRKIPEHHKTKHTRELVPDPEVVVLRHISCLKTQTRSMIAGSDMLL
jgi:hypothetical protein